LASNTTLLVGANNSGNSSAMLALRKFLLSKATAFRLQDLTLPHLTTIDVIGTECEAADETLALWLKSLVASLVSLRCTRTLTQANTSRPRVVTTRH